MMEYGASGNFKEQSQTGRTIKTEVEAAATFTALIDKEINLNDLKEERGLVQPVKSEAPLLVREEILEDSSQDRHEQNCVRSASPAGPVASVSVPADSVNLGETFNIKEEMADIHVYPTVLQYMDICYGTHQPNTSVARPVSAICHGHIYYALPSRVKEELVEDMSKDCNAQQCVQGTLKSTGTGSGNEACSASLGELLKVKHEMEEFDIGPTVLQHMDIHYTIDKTKGTVTGGHTIMDDCNKSITLNGQKKDSIEDKLRDNNTIPCKYCNHMKTDKFQQQLLCQHRGASSGAFKAPVTTNSAVVGSSNQSRNDTMKQKTFVCDVCDKGYSLKASLNLHKRSHSGVGLSVCYICDGKFTTKSSLARHLQIHTGEKPYQCNMCNSRFAQRGSLTSHMRVHTGEKPYQCDMCDARFAQCGALTSHMRIHTGEKPYQCARCDASFAQGNALTLHMRIHTGEKPYQCEKCDATFACRTTLIQHMRVHMGKKPYKCGTCDVRFAQNGALTKHMRIHTGEKPFQCFECGTKFACRSNLNTHKRKRHSK